MSDSVKVIGSYWKSTDNLNHYRIDSVDKRGYLITNYDKELNCVSKTWVHKQCTMYDVKLTKEEREKFEEEANEG